MDVTEIAKDFTALCAAGKGPEAGEKYWADDVVSVEAMTGPMAEVRGKAAVHGKGEWWYNAHDIHKADAHGPYVNGDRFAVRFDIDVTEKETGKRVQLDEIGLYALRDGKIVEERFFYGG